MTSFIMQGCNMFSQEALERELVAVRGEIAYATEVATRKFHGGKPSNNPNVRERDRRRLHDIQTLRRYETEILERLRLLA